MKKNRMMRSASALLVLCLLTTCIISGTYAKYVTTDEGSDTARVAKWGVTALVSGTLFGENYYSAATQDTGNEISATYSTSVASSGEDNDNIVAPGTKSDEGLYIGVQGTPEVSSKVAVTVDTTDASKYSDIYLATGSYGVMVKAQNVTADNFVGLYTKSSGGTYTATTSASTYDSEETYYKLIDEAEVSSAYYPIAWTVTPSVGSTSTAASVAELAAIIEALGTETDVTSGATSSIVYDAKDNLANEVGNVVITWEWDFDDDTAGTNDGADTILGDLIAYVDGTSNYQVVSITVDDDVTTYTGVTLDTTSTSGVTYAVAGEDTVACLTVSFNATVSVTQVD